MPRFSIIVPVYNVEQYLAECVESVLAQTFTDWEMILVDDGSPDNCPRLCDEWAGKDARIKVVHKKNGGASSARNVGIRESGGEYILFLDSDDFYNDKDALKTFDNKLKENETLSEEEFELSWKIKDLLEVLETIEKIPNIQLNSKKQMATAKNKIRIAIIANLRESEKNISKLFEKINLIYEVFDYPFDMESFISYMPTDDDYIPKEHTQEENEKRLLSRLDSFIHEQIRLYII